MTISSTTPIAAFVTVARSPLLDVYRGMAVLLMIIFHFCWDLREFGYLDYQLKDPFWVSFRAVIMTLFLTSIGWSAYLSQLKGADPKRFLTRQGKLLAAAVTISIVTYLAFPDTWIYFGILHFIFLASFMIYPIARYARLSGLLGLSILLVYLTTDWLQFPEFRHMLTVEYGFPTRTLDIVYPFPWLACIFLGPLLGYYRLHSLALPAHALTRSIAWFGKHAMPIYLLHQILLYGLVFAATMALRSLT